MTTTLALWLRAMNPVYAPRGMAEAQRSARSAVVGLGISLVVSLGQSLWTFSMPSFQTVMAAQYAAMGLSPADIAVQQGLMQSMWPFVVTMAVVLTLALFGVLALVQWKRMGRFIPLMLLGFIVYGAIVGGGLRLLGSAPPDLDLPLWLQLVSGAATAFAAVIYTAALQGGIMLHVLKGRR